MHGHMTHWGNRAGGAQMRVYAAGLTGIRAGKRGGIPKCASTLQGSSAGGAPSSAMSQG